MSQGPAVFKLDLPEVSLPEGTGVDLSSPILQLHLEGLETGSSAEEARAILRDDALRGVLELNQRLLEREAGSEYPEDLRELNIANSASLALQLGDNSVATIGALTSKALHSDALDAEDDSLRVSLALTAARLAPKEGGNSTLLALTYPEAGSIQTAALEALAETDSSLALARSIQCCHEESNSALVRRVALWQAYEINPTAGRGLAREVAETPGLSGSAKSILDGSPDTDSAGIEPTAIGGALGTEVSMLISSAYSNSTDQRLDALQWLMSNSPEGLQAGALLLNTQHESAEVRYRAFNGLIEVAPEVARLAAERLSTDSEREIAGLAQKLLEQSQSW